MAAICVGDHNAASCWLVSVGAVINQVYACICGIQGASVKVIPCKKFCILAKVARI